MINVYVLINSVKNRDEYFNSEIVFSPDVEPSIIQ